MIKFGYTRPPCVEKPVAAHLWPRRGSAFKGLWGAPAQCLRGPFARTGTCVPNFMGMQCTKSTSHIGFTSSAHQGEGKPLAERILMLAEFGQERPHMPSSARLEWVDNFLISFIHSFIENPVLSSISFFTNLACVLCCSHCILIFLHSYSITRWRKKIVIKSF